MANQITNSIKAAPEQPADLRSIGYPAAIMLNTNWKWDNPEVDLTRRTKGMIENLMGQVAGLKDRYDALLQRGQLTVIGVREQVAALARKDFVPVWKYVDQEAWCGIQATIINLRNQMVPKTDKADVAGAVLRADMRRIWGGLEIEARIGLLINPTRDLTAALLEVPGAMIGLKSADADMLMKHLGENQFPQQVATIEELHDVRIFLSSIMVFVQGDVMSMLKITAEDFEKLVWGDALPWGTKSFQLNSNGTGPRIAVTPGDVSGISTAVMYR